jgi:hypothetical protein
VVGLLEGKTVNLRVSEKEDLSLIGEWRNSPTFQGEHNLFLQDSKEELEKRYDSFVQTRSGS